MCILRSWDARVLIEVEGESGVRAEYEGEHGGPGEAVGLMALRQPVSVACRHSKTGVRRVDPPRSSKMEGLGTVRGVYSNLSFVGDASNPSWASGNRGKSAFCPNNL